jgi:gamma-glutamyl-gamma-aminobutyraldehyde dehydrogenase
MMQQARIDTLRAQPVAPQGLLIDGVWRAAAAGATLPVISPIDGTKLTTLADAGPDDVDAAVASARAAFERGVWAKAPPTERKRVLLRLAELIETHALELAVLGVRDNGTEIAMALRAEPGSAAATFRYYAEAIDKTFGEIAPTAQTVLALVHREPVGVVGAIVPWNFPLMIGAWKLAPALAAGNSVVLKPAEGASLTLLRLGQLALEASLPNGVLNVVSGRGPVAGDALARHMDVDVLVFTGSGAVGRRLLEASAQSNLKRVYLELGGKSPNIVFSDAPDLDTAVAGAVSAMFRNSGQVCVAGSRLLVQRTIRDAFTDKLVAAASRLKVSDPLDLKTEVGAVASAEQLRKNLSYVEVAIGEGGRLAYGGKRIREETGGYYMQPTIFADIDTGMRLANEEVFGPVLSIMTFDTIEDAARLANATSYGLAAGVWTSNLSTAHRMVHALRAGVVHVNCYGGTDMTVPMGGMKQSGNGYDKSLHALDKFTNRKSAWIQL